VTATVEEALEAFAAGEILVVADDEDRENEGDLILAAEHASADKLAFFVRHTSGLICAAITERRADELELPLMVEHNTEAHKTAFTVTVDAVEGTTTGISAADRATTIRALVDPATRPEDLARPGHLHVLRAREGGVLRRAGHTEAAVDLARLAGLTPAGVLAEIVTPDGLGMAHGEELTAFAKAHGLVFLTIAELIRYRRRRETLVERVASARLPTPYGEFTCHAYRSHLEGETHLAFVMGEPAEREDVLVRVHSECITGDIFGSLRCDCGPQLHAAMAEIQKAGVGVLVYLRGHEGRGIGIVDKLRAYSLQDEGLDTVDANLRLGLPVDRREYGIGAQILRDLGLRTIRLMTNNPAKRSGIEGFGLTVTGRVPLETRPNPENVAYLETKRTRLGHLLTPAEPHPEQGHVV
jgi:3,4-dihydroxy 2-butanone 4-phosphate synthase/GTP cyclohydrolase II